MIFGHGQSSTYSRQTPTEYSILWRRKKGNLTLIQAAEQGKVQSPQLTTVRFMTEDITALKKVT